MAPKRKSSDAYNSDMPKRSRKVLPLVENMFVCKKKCSIHKVQYYPWFQASTEGLRIYPLRIRGELLYFLIADQ